MTAAASGDEPSEPLDGDVPAAVAIRDASCLIVMDGAGDTLRLLLGRRNAGQVFLPNKWVFPGGRVDDADRGDDDAAAAADARHLLPEGAPDPLLAFARAGVRELHEETGFTIAQRAEAEADALHALLTPVARAITPPGRVRRYDTWFFIVRRERLSGALGPGDGELLDAAWFTVAQARDLDLPIITRYVLEDALAHLAAEPPSGPVPIPFYAQGAARFDRRLLALDAHFAPVGLPP